MLSKTIPEYSVGSCTLAVRVGACLSRIFLRRVAHIARTDQRVQRVGNAGCLDSILSPLACVPLTSMIHPLHNSHPQITQQKRTIAKSDSPCIKHIPKVRKHLHQALLVFMLLITFSLVNSSRSFSSSALLILRTSSVYIGIVMFFRAFALF